MCMMIADREVAANAPLFVIAEIGLNHGGDSTRRWRWSTPPPARVHRPSSCRACAARRWSPPACPAPAHVDSASLRDFFRRSSSTKRRMPLSRHAPARSAWPSCPRPFDEAAVDMLERRRLRRLQDRQRRPDSSPPDRARRADRQAARDFDRHERPRRKSGDAVAVARRAGATSIALLHCVSAYPVPVGSENLRAIATLDARLGPAGRPLRPRHDVKTTSSRR